MFIKTIILAVIFTQIVADNNLEFAVQRAVYQLYANDNGNFQKVINFVDNFNLPIENKIVGYGALIDVMKENKHLYGNDMMIIAQKLKEIFKNNPKVFKTHKNVLNQLPQKIQQFVTCEQAKFYNPTTKGFLYADMKLVANINSRYTFADGAEDDLTTTWNLTPRGNNLQLFNDFYTNECFYTDGYKRAFTWITSIAGCKDTSAWILEIVFGTDYYRLKNAYYNEYLYVSDTYVDNKRILKTQKAVGDSWDLQCVDETTEPEE